jgi:hypothetical protein
MAKLIKGSKAAKEYMAKIRAKKAPKKIGYKKDRTKILKSTSDFMKNYLDKGFNRKDAIKNAQIDAAYSQNKISGAKESKQLKKDLAAKKLRLPHGYETIKRTRVKKKISGIHKDTKSHNVKISVMSGVNDLQKLRDITENKITQTILINNELNFEIKNGFYTGQYLKDAKLSLAKNKIHLQFLKFTLKKLNDRILKNIK